MTYDEPSDTLTFKGMSGQDENYVRVSGAVSDVKLNPSGSTPLSFTLTSDEIGRPIEVLAMHGTSAASQLRQLETDMVDLVALRNIDLGQALQNRYVINLLAIDIA